MCNCDGSCSNACYCPCHKYVRSCNCSISCLFTPCECRCHYGENVAVLELTNTVYVLTSEEANPNYHNKYVEKITFSKKEAERLSKEFNWQVDEYEVEGKPDE